MTESKKLTIACVGEAMVELNVDNRESQIGFAGDTLNTAIYLARELGAAGNVDYVTVLGRDALSDRMAAFIEAEGVGTSRITRHATRLPGIYSIAVDVNGERSFSYWRDQSAARTLFEDSFAPLAGADVIYLSGITLAILPAERRETLLEHLRQSEATVVFDSNYRPRLWEDAETARRTIEAAWRATDIALPSLDDEMALFGDADASAVLARLRGYGLSRGALKRGGDGPLAISPVAVAGNFAQAENVVDTTAAGDSFNAAYLASILTGASEADALQAGHQLASHVIGIRGAIAPKA